jgi:hypothetical protein
MIFEQPLGYHSDSTPCLDEECQRLHAEQPTKTPWRFTSSARRPDGLEIECTITVDPEAYGPDFPEVSEIVQMSLVRTISTLQRNDRLRVEVPEPAYTLPLVSDAPLMDRIASELNHDS